MSKGQSPDGKLRLAWVSPVTPWKLDSVTWLDTTQELRKLGMDVTLLAAGPPSVQSYRGIEVTNIERPDTYLLGRVIFHINLLRFLWPRLADYDYLLFHSLSAVWLLPLRLAGRNRPLLVMDSRDVLDFGLTSFKARARNGFERFSYWLAEHFADGQTAITRRLAQLVGIPPHQLWGIWPSGVDPDAFAPARDGRTWPGDGEPVRLAYAGVFTEKRNLLPLVDAVTKAGDEGMDFRLHLYGDGPLRPELEARAARSNGRVRVEQPVPFSEIPAMLAANHIGVTSLPVPDDVKFAASSPLKLFEYMAAGMPVLATSSPCHTDVVGDSRYAFWVDAVTTEGILAGLRDAWQARDDLPQLGAEAYAAVADWTWAASAGKLHAALEGGLQRHTPARTAAAVPAHETNH